MEPMIEEWEDWYASAGWPTTREYIDEEFYGLGMSPSDDLIVMEVSGMKGYNALQDYVNSLCPAPSDYRNTPTARHLHPDGTWSLVFVFRYENGQLALWEEERGLAHDERRAKPLSIRNRSYACTKVVN